MTNSRFPERNARRTTPLPAGQTIDDRCRVLVEEIRQPPIGVVVASPAAQAFADWCKAEVKAAVEKVTGKTTEQADDEAKASADNIRADAIAATKASIAAAISAHMEEGGDPDLDHMLAVINGAVVNDEPARD